MTMTVESFGTIGELHNYVHKATEEGFMVRYIFQEVHPAGHAEPRWSYDGTSVNVVDNEYRYVVVLEEITPGSYIIADKRVTPVGGTGDGKSGGDECGIVGFELPPSTTDARSSWVHENTITDAASPRDKAGGDRKPCPRCGHDCICGGDCYDPE